MRSRHLRLVAALLALAGACVGDQGYGPAQPVDEGSKADGSSPTGSPIGPAAEAAWRAYQADLEQVSLQPGCHPFESVLPPSVAYHGTAVLFHGFTACPQQFVELAGLLGRQGIVVLAPLLPGEGRTPKSDATGNLVDDVSQVPGDDDVAAYAQFADRMADVLTLTRGVHVVGGVSLGATLAARAAEDDPDLTRAVLMNSFFDPAGFTAIITAPLNALAPHYRVSWGAGCEAERARGRAGACQFEVTQLRAVQRFGEATASRAAALTLPVQNLGVEDDKSASPDAIAAVGDALGSSGQTCFFEPGVNHSLLSRYDAPDEDKFWLPATLAQVTRFIATGVAFDTVAGSDSIRGYPRCRDR